MDYIACGLWETRNTITVVMFAHLQMAWFMSLHDYSITCHDDSLLVKKYQIHTIKYSESISKICRKWIHQKLSKKQKFKNGEVWKRIWRGVDWWKGRKLKGLEAVMWVKWWEQPGPCLHLETRMSITATWRVWEMLREKCVSKEGSKHPPQMFTLDP